MSNGWHKTYSELNEYIAQNPKIKISQKIVVLPGDVRPEFYQLFDKVRVAFLKEKFQTLLDEAAPLSKNYAEVGQEVTKSLGLSEIKVPASLNWFLNDPVNGLTRTFFNLLFDLVKDKIDTENFEKLASSTIEKAFKDFYRKGYERWVVLSLLELLAADRALTVPIVDVTTETSLGESEVIPGSTEELVPNPEETKSLTLMHEEYTSFIVPDMIVHSAKTDRYVAIRTECTNAVWKAKLVSDKREWYPLPSIEKELVTRFHWPDLIINSDDKPEDLVLVADYIRICRPDLIVECMEQADWYQQGGLEKMRRNHDFFKPRLGSYVVSRLPVPEEAFKELIPEPAAEGAASIEPTPAGEPEEQATGIHILTVGFDQSQLTPIIEALSPEEKDTEEAENQ